MNPWYMQNGGPPLRARTALPPSNRPGWVGAPVAAATRRPSLINMMDLDTIRHADIAADFKAFLVALSNYIELARAGNDHMDYPAFNLVTSPTLVCSYRQQERVVSATLEIQWQSHCDRSGGGVPLRFERFAARMYDLYRNSRTCNETPLSGFRVTHRRGRAFEYAEMGEPPTAAESSEKNRDGVYIAERRKGLIFKASPSAPSPLVGATRYSIFMSAQRRNSAAYKRKRNETTAPGHAEAPSLPTNKKMRIAPFRVRRREPPRPGRDGHRLPR